MEILENLYNLEVDKEIPINIRERYYTNINKIPKKIFDPIFILSTCNRISIFTISNLENLQKLQSIIFPDITPKIRKGIDTIKHFFSIACGLESQIFAETDIIQQIKQQYKNQKESLNYLLEEMIISSLSIHKEFHTQILPKIKKQKQNLAEIILKKIENYDKSTPIILIGYGLLNQTIYKKFKNIFKNITIFSDTYKKALPKKTINQKIKEIINQKQENLIIISATYSESYLIDHNSQLPPKTVIFDLSVPRSIDPSLKYPLFDLDKLKENQEKYLPDEKIIHNFLNLKVEEFINKIITNNLKETIKKFFEIPLVVAEEKINKYYSELINILKNQDEKEIKEFLKYINQKIVNKTLEEPIKKIKELYILNQKKKIIVGTRGSKLALIQTNEILELLKLYFPSFHFEIKIIKTSGDKNIYTTNSFTKELEEALITEEIDIAVHSLKDLPYKSNQYLQIASIPIRIEPNDVLISKNNQNFWELKPNSIIGTSSPRRKKQLELLRNDLIFKEIRGNIDTRINKLFKEDFDAIVVAYAAIKRLNLEKLISYIFPIEELVPAPGQGAIAIQTRKHSFLTNLLKKLDNPIYRKEIEIEREFMGILNLGCSFPLGANAQIKNNQTILSYFVFINNKIFKGKVNNPNINQIISDINQ